MKTKPPFFKPYNWNYQEGQNVEKNGSDSATQQSSSASQEENLEEVSHNTSTDSAEAEEPFTETTKIITISQEELEALHQEKKFAEEERLRAFAELENVKKRTQKEKEDFSRFAAESILNDILPAMDNLDLALQHAPKDDACKGFVVGVEMTKRLMLDALKKHGLEEVGSFGQPFDPAIHEAVGMADIPEVPDNHVSSLLSRGYMLNQRLLRPAKVIVSKHQ